MHYACTFADKILQRLPSRVIGPFPVGEVFLALAALLAHAADFAYDVNPGVLECMWQVDIG